MIFYKTLDVLESGSAEGRVKAYTGWEQRGAAQLADRCERARMFGGVGRPL